jgi:hypothetical protein
MSLNQFPQLWKHLYRLTWQTAASPLMQSSLIIGIGILTAGTSAVANSAGLEQKVTTPKVFTAGISITSDRRVYERVPSSLLRGYENGEEAIDFDHWLVPFDNVLKALQLKPKPLSNDRVELRSASHVVNLNLKTLTTDPDLGLVMSVKEIKELFGLQLKFDFRDYAIVIDMPETLPSGGKFASTVQPASVEGLPQVKPDVFSPSMVEQRIRSTGTTVSEFKTQGTLLTVGTVLGGSWYAEVDQRKVLDLSTWQLTSLQYLRQTPKRDLYIGSQPTFWQSQSAGDFWGLTTIGRQGYLPLATLGSSGGANPTVRMQPSSVTGSLNGYAEPGTLVRLVRGGEGGLIVAEQLVDGTGRYQFNQVPIGRDQDSGTNYSILLYPRGQLTAKPRVETPRFTILPEQLPKGGSSNILSAGWRRSRSENSWFGGLTDLNVGVAQRWGLTESVTVGVGTIYDNQQLQGLGEFFFQTKQMPLRLGVTGLFGSSSTVRADAVWDDYPNIYAQVSYGNDKTTYSLDLALAKSALRFLSYGDSDRGTNWGFQYSGALFNGSTYARLILQPNQRFSWNLYQNWNKFSFSHRKADAGLVNYATYQINPWHSLVAEYNTAERFQFDNLGLLYWRYRSPKYQRDGSSLWTADLGYGLGTRGNGPYVALTTSIVPGLNVQARYQGISLYSNTGDYSVALISSLGTQSGLYAGNRRLDELRTQGGLMVQPFYDRNGNGKRDGNEAIYSDSSDFLILNNELVTAQRIETHRDRLLVRLLPGTYRLDLEAGAFPPEFQPAATSMAVQVHEGSYTPISIPLQPAYTASGMVDHGGQPVNGARVEATNLDSKQVQLTTTNTAGIYYLEALRRGTYRVTVNGKPAQPEMIQINESSKSLEEINFTLP